MAETPQSPDSAAEQPLPATAAGAPGPETSPAAAEAPSFAVSSPDSGMPLTAATPAEPASPEPPAAAEAPVQAPSPAAPAPVAEPALPTVSPASPGPAASFGATPDLAVSTPSAPPSDPSPAVPSAAPSAAEPPAAPSPAPAEPAPSEPEPTLAGVAATISVPPLESAATEGGEWELLVSKLRAWIDGADLQERWNALGGPLRAFGLLLTAVVVLRLYGALLDTLGDLPLLPRLLQLVGLISLIRFCLTRLVRSSERERILSSWRERWNDFRGRS